MEPSNRELPVIPNDQRPHSFWSKFVPKEYTTDSNSIAIWDHGENQESSFSESDFPPNPDNISELRHEFERSREPEIEKVKEREKTRQSLSQVTQKLDSNRYPLTTKYVETWLTHNHSPEENYHVDCNVCVENRFSKILYKSDTVNNLKFTNPLTAKGLSSFNNEEADFPPRPDDEMTVSEKYQFFTERSSKANFSQPPVTVDQAYDGCFIENGLKAYSEYNNLTDEVFFSDGVRKIDFVLVYHKTDKANDKNEKKKQTFRKKYFGAIQKDGVQLELLNTPKTDKKLAFVCVHIPFHVLAHYAEVLNIRAPMTVGEDTEINWSYEFQQKWLKCIPNIMYQELPYRRETYFTAPFRKESFHKFVGSDDPETFFKIRHRIRIAHEILNAAEYGQRRKCEVGYERLVESGGLCAAYPIHDGHFKPPESLADNCYLWNSRQILKFFWANPKQWFKYQPVDLIRDYFGEKMSLYFAWLGFYTMWLLIASLIALVVVIASVATMFDNVAAEQICDSGETFVMCPQCDFGCETWFLSDTCMYARVAHLFDNASTIFFGGFISLWSVFFLEFWKRSNATLAYRWDVHDFQPQEEKPRYQYVLKSTLSKPNPVTGQEEPHFPKKTHLMRIVVGIVTLLSMMMIVLIFVIGVIIYRSLIMEPLYDLSRNSDTWDEKYTPLIAVATGALIQVVLIQISGFVYSYVAHILTEWETHRTENEHENHLAFKIFIFQFLNQYSAVLYVAFFKGRFSGYPGNYTKTFRSDARLEQCTNNDCLMEMAQNLAIIFVGKQIVNNTMEVGKPILMRILNNWKTRSKDEVERHQIEAEFNLPECPDLFEEYLEMVLQFGFVTIFSCSFPLAPVCALINNFIEIRVDANKYVCQVRRGIPLRAKNIGIWFELMAGISRVAVLCNAFLILFTSDFLNKVFYKHIHNEPELDGYIEYNYPFAPTSYLSQQGNDTEPCRYRGLRNEEGELTEYYWKLFGLKLVFLLLFEHLVIVIGIMIDWFVPDIPEELDLKIKREQFIAKQTFSAEVPQQFTVDKDDDEELFDDQKMI